MCEFFALSVSFHCVWMTKFDCYGQCPPFTRMRKVSDCWFVISLDLKILSRDCLLESVGLECIDHTRNTRLRCSPLKFAIVWGAISANGRRALHVCLSRCNLHLCLKTWKMKDEIWRTCARQELPPYTPGSDFRKVDEREWWRKRKLTSVSPHFNRLENVYIWMKTMIVEPENLDKVKNFISFTAHSLISIIRLLWFCIRGKNVVKCVLKI